MRAIEIAKEIGADAVDFDVSRYDLRNEKHIKGQIRRIKI